jgi:hypothetical protein
MKYVQITKSAVQGMACEYYFARLFLDPNRELRRIDLPFRLTGQQFHQYHDEYIQHLSWEHRNQDQEWVTNWIAEHPALTEDARDLIAWDATKFKIHPDDLIGTEVFISGDKELNPLDCIPQAHYGEFRASKGAEYTVYVDLIQRETRSSSNWLICTDYKTSYNTDSVHDYEAYHNATLAFLAYPDYDNIEWRWEFGAARDALPPRRAAPPQDPAPGRQPTPRRDQGQDRGQQGPAERQPALGELWLLPAPLPAAVGRDQRRSGGRPAPDSRRGEAVGPDAQGGRRVHL